VSSSDKIPLLIVEDDTRLSGSLADFLSERGYDVDFAFNGVSGVELARCNEYAVIVMDVRMPIMDGLSACHELRHEHGIQTPIIFLTARDTLDDKIAGYQSGGDDYLVKPFAPEELVCRVEALRKRSHLASAKDLTLGDLTIHPSRHQVTYAGQALELQDTHIRLLMILASAAPDVVSKRALEAGIWPDETPRSSPLRNHVYRLRRLLDDKFGHPFIKTVHGKGYRIELPD
jgi:DNA-binding response OmpR family regulator